MHTRPRERRHLSTERLAVRTSTLGQLRERGALRVATLRRYTHKGIHLSVLALAGTQILRM